MKDFGNLCEISNGKTIFLFVMTYVLETQIAMGVTKLMNYLKLRYKVHTKVWKMFYVQALVLGVIFEADV